MSLPEDLNMEDLPAQPYSSPRLLKWLYCTHRVGSTLALLPYWAIKYACSKRPRPSWSLAETLLIDFTRRVSAISDRAGVQHATRDPTAQPDGDSLRETRFEWVPGIAGELCCGVLDDAQVRPLKRVGTFVWERAQDVRADYNMINSKTSNEGDAASTLSFRPDAGDKGDLVGVYFHGGGYTHFSAHESAQTSAIPRRLMQYDYFASIHSVEYRLLPASSFPAALQDGISVYAHLIRSGVPAEKIVLIGDSAGGNVVLAMARWIRDEQKLPAAGGLLLLSPWCDPSRSFPESTSSYVARPNPEDYLADAPSARRLLVTSLLGDKPHDFLSSPYISPASAFGPEGCFGLFPPTFVHYGDAERLVDEIDALIEGMKRDGVDLDVEKTVDAVHDVLMVRFWNEEVRGHVYERVCGWLDGIVARAQDASRSSSLALSSSTVGKGPVPSTSASPAQPTEAATSGALGRAPGAPLVAEPSPAEPHETTATGAEVLPGGNLKVGEGHLVSSAPPVPVTPSSEQKD